MSKFRANANFKNYVFGADDLLVFFPELEGAGVEVVEIDALYYISKDGNPVSDSSFFSHEEFDECLELVGD